MAHWVQRGIEGEGDARRCYQRILHKNCMSSHLLGGVEGSQGDATEEQIESIKDESIKDIS